MKLFGARHPLRRLALNGAAASLALAGLAPLSSALGMKAKVGGVDDAVADNIEVYLKPLKASAYRTERLIAEVQRLTAEAMRPFGYYAPEIAVNIVDNRADIDIDPGKPVRIELLDFTLEGEAAEDKTFISALDAYPQEEGDVLLHAPYDALRSKLSSLALQRGYFDWSFLDRRMEIRPWEHSARLYLRLDSGERYRFGRVEFQGYHIELERLENLVPFSAGDPYLAGEVARLSQSLAQTRWFGSISVRPRLDQGDVALLPQGLGFWNELDVEGIERVPPAPRLSGQAVSAATRIQQQGPPSVPIDVVLAPADRHQFEFGIGYATDVGPRTRLTWNQPWINRYGHRLNHDLYFSAPEQQLTGLYEMPLDDPLRDSYRLQYGLRHQDDDDTRTLESTVEAARRWTFDNDWEQSLYVRGTYEDFTQAGVSNQVLLLYPGISWSRTRTRHPAFPTWGDRQRLAVEYSSDAWGSAAEFLRITGDSEWIRMLGDDSRFVGRVGVGSITTDDFEDIPPSLRFFTGGDRSVRGYAYESLSPKDDKGRLVGGEQLFTASVEAQRRITGKWWMAGFVDTGDAFSDWWPDDLNTGAGLGVRWVSPVGPIRFDVAHPFDSDDAYRIHFAIGPEF
ncbi:MAG TPA: autotransporter assembly complex family protein [Halomonas sp.]|nr:autotransporter assembly complex family protein [Halomonas sp.]